MIAEYIWIGGNGELRSKTRVLPSITSIADIPLWNYDGSSTHQATTESSEVDLIPVKLYKNPLMQEMQGWLVLCETYANDQPHPTNHRHAHNHKMKSLIQLL